MTTRGMLAVVLVASGLMLGCDKDEKRTNLACSANGGDACGTMQSDVPTEMWCNSGFQEVDSCPDTGILATCTVDEGPFHLELRVYDESALDYYQGQCQSSGGSWAEL